ncbi:MAG: hypothetical protein J6W61_04830, partial [Bacteroidales bacterium]|nr:hypothetical protein [Bacteroidales bacterium]
LAFFIVSVYSIHKPHISQSPHFNGQHQSFKGTSTAKEALFSFKIAASIYVYKDTKIVSKKAISTDRFFYL